MCQGALVVTILRQSSYGETQKHPPPRGLALSTADRQTAYSVLCTEPRPVVTSARTTQLAQGAEGEAGVGRAALGAAVWLRDLQGEKHGDRHLPLLLIKQGYK